MRLALAFLVALCAQAQTANLWIDANGGTCTRQGTPASYSDAAACSSIQAALAAASAGDTVIMKSGSYGSQTITAEKSSPGVLVKCENTNWDAPFVASASKNSCIVGASGGSVTAGGSWYTLQDITLDGGDARGPSWTARCSNCTFKNWNVHGDFVAVFWMPVQGSPGGNSTNIVWDGGELFDPDNPSGARTCTQSDDQPMWMAAMSDSSNFFGNGRIVDPIIRHVQFNPAFGDNVACSGDPLHLERLRIDGNIDNLLLDGNIFADGGNENTGTIFISNFLGSVPGVTFRNNYISGSGTAVLQNNTGGSCPWVFQYNTLTGQPTYTGCSSGMTYTGNVIAGLSVCQGTHTKNVFTGGLSSCGTDYKSTSLGLGTFNAQAGTLQPTSGTSDPVNRGETTCASTTTDIRGYTRPASGTNCDAGAFEYGATSGSGVAPTITSTSPLPDGTVGTAYSQTLTAAGDATITWSVTSGSLPAGLSLSSGGAITGTPTTAGTSTPTMTATNSTGSDAKVLSITINAAPSGPTAGMAGKVSISGKATIK